MDSVSVRDINAHGSARIHVGNSSVTHIHNYAEGQEHLESTPKPFSLIPFSRDPDFVPRGDLLGRIATQCAQPGGRAALVGLGGVGKSQLAIEYAYQAADIGGGTWVFWVHAGTKARVEEGFRAIADAIKLPDRHLPKADVPRLLHAWLSNETNGRWLMILDSADDYDVFYGAEPGKDQPLASYLPQSPNGSVLVTTRDQGLAVRLTGNYRNIIKVGPMESDEAVSFLEKKLGVSAEPELATELVTTLDCIPLAINQAASYIQARAPRSGIKKYLAEFKESDKRSAKLLAHDAAELRRDGSSSNAIMKTWQISFDHIRSKQPSAADLLALMSFFDNQSIPEVALNPGDEYDSDCESDLESNWDSEELANHASMRRLLEAKKRRENINSDENDLESDTGYDFEDDIALLRDYCLISVRESGTHFDMHRLVQLATKKWLASSKRQEEFKQLFIYRLALSTPSTDGSNELQYRELASHFQIAICYRPNKTNLRFWFYLCFYTSWYMAYMGQYGEAKALLERAVEVWESRKGREHYEYLMGQRHIATYMLELDQYDKSESEAILLEVLEVEQKSPDSTAALHTMQELATNYGQQGKYQEAERLQLQVIEKRTASLGSEHRLTLQAMSSLMGTYYDQSRYNESEEINLQVIAITRKVFGPSHFETLCAMANLAVLYEAQYRYDEAIEVELEALQLQPVSCQFEDETSIARKMLLARCYRLRSFHDKALALNQDILRILTAKFGSHHDKTLAVMQDVARGFKDLYRYEESAKIFEMAVEGFKSLFGLTHSTTVDCIQQLARVYSYDRQPSKAAELLSEALEINRSTSGPLDDITLGIMVELAKLYERQLLFSKASDLFSQVLATCKQTNDVDFLDSLSIWGGLSISILQSQGQYEDLAAMLQDVLTLRRQKYSLDDDLVIETALQLARVKDSLKQWDDAASVRAQIVQLYEKKHGKTHPLTLDCMSALAKGRREQENYDEAKRLQSFVLEARKERLGLFAKETLSSMQELAMTLEDQGQLVEAEALYRQTIQGHEAQSMQRSVVSIWILEHLAHTVAAQAVDKKSRVEEATTLLRDALEANECHFGPGTWEVCVCARTNAWLLGRLELFEEATVLAETAHEGFTALLGPYNDQVAFCSFLLYTFWDARGDCVRSVERLGECLRQHRHNDGAAHPDTVGIQESWDDLVACLEEHVAEHAAEPDHPTESCETCRANKIAKDWVFEEPQAEV